MELLMFEYKFIARYADLLEELLMRKGFKQVLREEQYGDETQGILEVDVLLHNNTVYSYTYTYADCKDFDEWESQRLSKRQIQMRMWEEAVIFDDIEQYKNWREAIKLLEDN
jgi:hypothetical protein